MSETTVRESIWTDIKETIEGVSEIKTVELHKASPIALDIAVFPAAYIYLEADAGEEGNREETWVMKIAVEVWTKNDDLEDLLGKVHQAMYEDKTRGGYADHTVRTGSEIFMDIVPDRSIGVVMAKFDVVYKHVQGNPFTQEE